jgi:hypothetical protein
MFECIRNVSEDQIEGIDNKRSNYTAVQIDGFKSGFSSKPRRWFNEVDAGSGV